MKKKRKRKKGGLGEDTPEEEGERFTKMTILCAMTIMRKKAF